MDEAMAGECEEKIIRYDEVPLLLDQEVEEPEPAKRQKCFTCFIGTSRKSRAELLRKEILNHWGPKTLLYMEMLSIGKFSCVAKVRHATNGQVFVVKMLKKLNKLAPEQLLKRFLSEGQAWCTVNGYKFILTLYAYYDTTIGYYFVSEYIHGGSLEDVLLSSIHLSENRCKWVLAQLALAINYLHSKDICHCDVKPSNVLLSDEWIVKLADFGFCQPKGYLLERWGTIAYMAPEILLGKQYDEAIDWWSYGVVAYRLMTGLSPVEAYVVSLGISYSSLTIPERIQACLEAPIDIPYGMSMGAADFLRCMLVEDPWRRLPYYNEEEDFRPVKNHIFFSEIHWPLLEDTGRPVERYPANTLAIAKRYAKRHRYRFRKLRMGVS